MIERFSRFPRSLADKARTLELGPTNVPTLLAHPDWQSPAPVMFWMHGRTVNKELDPGRYLRWIRSGIATCAIDLPGHGQRYEAKFQHPARTPEMIQRVLPEIDQVLDALRDPEFGGAFDLTRIGIGGMSGGGMVALRRLCDPHPFHCAAVEATTGDLGSLYHPDSGRPWVVDHDEIDVKPVDPAQHLDSWRPIPLLAMHSEKDEVVPISGMRGFLDSLRTHYARSNADEQSIEFVTWPATGAALEHAGFGQVANDAKKTQVDFLKRHLIGPTRDH